MVCSFCCSDMGCAAYNGFVESLVYSLGLLVPPFQLN